MSKDQIEKYSLDCYNIQHQESMSKVISIAKGMNQRGVNKSFSSFTRKGLNLIFLPDDGIVVSNSGTDNEGSAIIFSNQLKYFIKKSKCPSNS